MNAFFLENWQFNRILGHLLSPTNILCLKGYPRNLKKYDKIPITQLFSELGEIWKYNQDLYF